MQPRSRFIRYGPPRAVDPPPLASRIAASGRRIAAVSRTRYRLKPGGDTIERGRAMSVHLKVFALWSYPCRPFSSRRCL